MEKTHGDFIGIDASLETSLFEYGLIVCPYYKDGVQDEYFCVYSIGEGFDTGYKREHELNDLLAGLDWMDNDDIESFLSTVGGSLDDWQKLPFVTKLHDLINYYGYEYIMGTSYLVRSKEEIITSLKYNWNLQLTSE